MWNGYTSQTVLFPPGKESSLKGMNLFIGDTVYRENKGKRKVHGVPQSQTAALPRHQEEEETDKTKQAQIEQTYEMH